MALQQTEGIVLHSIQFQDYDQILTVFTQAAGCIKTIIKGGYRIDKERNIVLGPLMKANFLFDESRGELYRCPTFSLLDPYLKIREQLNYLQAACDLLQTLRFFQYPGVAAPQLYQLLTFLLDKIPKTRSPEIFATIFRIKIWKHEGILDLDLFSDKEKPTILHLAECRSLALLLETQLSPELELKVKQLFLL